MKTAKKPSHWIFRLHSNRGTDIVECLTLPPGTTKDRARQYAYRWADERIRGSAVSECTVSYKRTRLATRSELLRRWDALCKQYYRLQLLWREQRAKLAPRDWIKR